MGFLQPLYFWLLFLLIVLIIFYLFKQTFTKRYISSTYLWDETLKNWDSNHWWLRFINNILFYLQALIILLIILALAGPFFLSEKEQLQHHVFILDTSASMKVATGEVSRFQEAKEEIQERIEQLSNGEPISVIIAKAEPEILVTQESNHRNATELIERLSISYQQAKIDESILLAESLAGENGMLYLYSDSYSNSNEVEVNVPLIVDNLKQDPENISLHSFGVRSNESLAEAVVTVKNHEDSNKQITLLLQYRGEVFQQKAITLLPYEEKVIDFIEIPLRPYYQVKMVEEDDYPLDNQQYALVQGSNGDTTVHVMGEVNWFYLKALQSSGVKLIHNSHTELEASENAVYLVGELPADKWPNGPKIIVNPIAGGPFAIGEKQSLTEPLTGNNSDGVLEYVDLKDVYLTKAYKINEPSTLESIVKSGDTSVISKGSYHGEPLYLFSFDLKDSDWPLHSSFPILMQNILFDLESNHLGSAIGYFSPGEMRTIPYAIDSTSFVVRNEKGTRVLSSEVDFNRIYAPNKPGLYQAEWKEDQQLIQKYFAVQIDQGESDITSYESFSVNEGEAIPTSTAVLKESLWRWFAALAFILLLIELEVIRYRYTT